MNKKALDIILEGVANREISVDSAAILIEAIKYPKPIEITPPNITQRADWTYDPYRPGSPWYTVTSHTSGYSEEEETTNNNLKTTLTANG